jgi:hypothetical protein
VDTTGKTTAPKKRLQLHGGALNAGGTKGNKGGRPASEIRDLCAQSFAQRIAKAEAILDNDQSSNADKLKALDLLGKYGGLIHTTSDTTVTKRPHREAVEEVRRRLGLDAA